MIRQKNALLHPIYFTGIGAITGKVISVKIYSLKNNSGIVIKRTDLKSNNIININVNNIYDTKLNTTIGTSDDSCVKLTEHLLSSLWHYDLYDIMIELDGPEIPIMDGSAKYFCFMISSSGIVKTNDNINEFYSKSEFTINGKNDSWIKCEPCDHLVVEYNIDYSENTIGKQVFLFDTSSDNFLEKIAQAKTFCTQTELNYRQDVFAKHWNENFAIIYGDDYISCGYDKLRYNNEHIRHKILDIIGDLMISGLSINAKLTCYKSGHTLNTQLVKKLMLEI